MVRERRPYLNRILTATKNPTRLALLLIALAAALPTAPLGPDGRLVFVRCLVLGTICLIGWTALKVLRIGANLYLRNFRIDVPDDFLARKHVTQVRVLMRVLDIIIVLLTFGFALMTFDSVRQYGISVFPSAGVAGVVFGLAAQPVLSNLIAGIQLALTQPIRLEDAVTVQNEYGWIEKITATYVVIRLVGQTKQPGGKLVNVQVTNASPEAIEIRVLVTAATVGDTSNLCAELREKLIGFLQSECAQALPRRRHEISELAMHKSGTGSNTASA
jgi:small-conductance mechanosensitive channel